MRIPWYIKAAVQKSIAALPFAPQLNYLFQRHITRSLTLSDALLMERVERVQQHLLARQPQGTALELGTGWFPVVPVLLWLYGYEKVLSVDIRSHIRPALLAETREAVLRLRPQIEATLGNADAQRWQQLAEAKPLPSAIVWLTADARSLSLPPKSVDFVVSNNTFEHIPADILREILAAFTALLHPSGSMSHYVDMHDHYAYSDARISPYHFLRYSPRQWQWIENRLQSQNRLRLPQYRALFQETGWAITQETPEWGFPEILRQEPLYPVFRQMDVDECAALYVHIVARLTTHSQPPTSP